MTTIGPAPTEVPRRYRIVPTSASNGYGDDGRWLAQYWDPETRVWFDHGDPHPTKRLAMLEVFNQPHHPLHRRGDDLYQLEVAQPGHGHWHYHEEPHPDGTPGQPQHHHDPACEHRTALLVPLFPTLTAPEFHTPALYRRHVDGVPHTWAPGEPDPAGEPTIVLVPEGGVCPDCGVDVGQRHEEGCDVARCKGCGLQQLQCGDHRDLPMTVWTGEWPGVVECRELELWGRWSLPEQRSGRFLPCAREDEGASEDLGRLGIMECTGEVVWDQAAERFRRPHPPGLRARF